MPAAAVHHAEDPALVLEAVRPLLEQRPVEHNLVHTLLLAEAAAGTCGRFWWAERRGGAVAVLHECPLGRPGILATVDAGAIDAVVDRAAADAPQLAGVQSSAAAAARFAGRWSDVAAAGAAPVEAQRLYRLDELVRPPAVPGRARWATTDELDVVDAWVSAFAAEVDQPRPPRAVIGQRIEQRRVWVWDDGAPASIAMVAPAAARTTRVGGVYTPPERRGRGLAAAVVAACSEWALAEEADVCLLFTQLQNATSNGVYRRLGYRAVDEVLRYRFSPTAAR